MNALAIPVNQEEINRFHFTDRRLYAILALELCWNPSKALSIITFWISMERLGFRNTVVNILSLPTQVINSFAREAITCLNFINALPVQSSSHIYIPLTQLIISKRICLQFFVEKRAIIFHHRTEVTNQVCHRALMDIMTEAQDRNDAWLRAERDMVISPLPGPTLLGGGNEHSDKRTLLVAFSRGYPVVEQEMRNFFAGHYGKCIESLFMQEVKLCEEPMYARIVLYDVSTIDAILAGKEKARLLVINGRRVWVRKFVQASRE